MPQSKVIVIGGGIVGLATAYRFLQQHPGSTLTVLEKEARPAEHQTGHNSGVLHSGIYYKPGSLKAINCREGKKAMEEFCAQHGIAHELCGKVIVSTQEWELPNMQKIYERGQANGVRCELISKERLKEIEPHVAGIAAIHVPEAGIVNYRQVCEKLAELIGGMGGKVVYKAKVTAMEHRNGSTIVKSTAGEFETAFVVNCAGLYCDKVTQLSGQDPQSKIVPFRGEYFEVKHEYHHLCRNLIYPVPDPSFPFLGVHFTRMINGHLECGPNAVLAFAREGYKKTDINIPELIESLTYGGFIRMASKYWKTGMGEMWRSFSKAAFVKALQRLIPEVQAHMLEPAPAGVRAQALLPDGSMVDDFLIRETERVINVCNAPSPAATASLNIGKLVVEKLNERLK